MTRCPTCGLRLRPGASCPRDGERAPAEVSGEAGAWPELPGYRVHGQLGRGGFAVVLRASRLRDGVDVALKLALDEPEAKLRLAREARVLGALGPPTTPALLESGELPGGRAYLALELIGDPTLADWLADHPGPHETARALARFGGVLDAVEALHAAGFVHRDLKPENVFVAPGGSARLIDFGLGLALAPGAHAAPDVTAAGQIVGTAEYMAPEQCDGRSDLDASADIYALGVILYELVTGAPPFFGPTAVVQLAHRTRRPAPLGANVPAAVAAVVLRCLAKPREERFGDVRQLREALAAAASPTQPAPAATAAATAGPPGGARSQRVVSAVAFEAAGSAPAVQRVVEAAGGTLAHAQGGRYVALFDGRGSDRPARHGVIAARRLRDELSCARMRLDVLTVTIQRRSDGSTRLLSTRLGHRDLFPRPDAPAGILVTAAFRELVPTCRATLVDGEPELYLLHDDRPDERTALRMSDAPLVGRDATLVALLESAEAAAGRARPTIARILGEPGHGKSRLAAALVQALERRWGQDHLLEVRGHAPGEGEAEHTVRELLGALLAPLPPPPADGGRAFLDDRLSAVNAGESWPAVANALGWLRADAPALAPMRSAPGALRSALSAAIGSLVRERARRRGGLFVILDDAHHADDATLSGLEYAGLSEAAAPLWIVAVGRTSFESARPGWGDRAADRFDLRLGPLDGEAARELCRRLLLPAVDVPEDGVERLVARTQGVPLLLVELVRGLKRAGLVRPHPRGDGWFVATDALDEVTELPLVEWLATRELATLSPDLAAHARLVALLGDRVTDADVEGLIRELEATGGAADFPLDARVATSSLTRTELLIRHGDGTVGFRHALVREAIARGVPAALRQRIHEAALRHFSRADRGEESLARVAHHAASSGHRDTACQAYLRLAERAQGRHAYLDAETAFSRVLGLLDAGDLGHRRAAYRGRGLVRYRLGRYHDALEDFAGAREIARHHGDRLEQAEILLDEATALDWMDDYRRSEERVSEAERIAEGVGSALLEARLRLGRGRSLHRFSREEEAARQIERAAELATKLGDGGYETRVIALIMLGFIHQGTGRIADASRALDEAVALCEERGDRLHLVSAVNNRALLYGCIGDHDRLTGDLRRVVELARLLGLPMLEVVGHYNLAEHLYYRGEVDRSLEHMQRAAEVERRRHAGDGRPVVDLLEARILHFAGDVAGAAGVVARIRAGQTRARDAGRLDALLVPSEEVLLDMVDLATRDAGEREWDALEQRAHRFSVGQELVEVIEARGLAAQRGLRPGGELHLQRAIELTARIPTAMSARLAPPAPAR